MGQCDSSRRLLTSTGTQGKAGRGFSSPLRTAAHLNSTASCSCRHSISQTPLLLGLRSRAVVAEPTSLCRQRAALLGHDLLLLLKIKHWTRTAPYIKDIRTRLMVFKGSFIQAQTLHRWVLFPWQKIVSKAVWQFCRISHASLSAPKPNPPLSNFDANVVLLFGQSSLQCAHSFGRAHFLGEEEPFTGSHRS